MRVPNEGEQVPALTMIICFAAAAFVALMINGCPPPDPKPPAPQPIVDVDNGTPCSKACEHLRDLDCPEGEPTSNGTTCEQVCENALQEGQPLNTTCVAEIENCADLNTQCR